MDLDRHVIRRQADGGGDLCVGQVLKKLHVDDGVFVLIEFAQGIVQLSVRFGLYEALLRRRFVVHEDGSRVVVDPFVPLAAAKVAGQFASHNRPKPRRVRTLALLKLADDEREHLGGDGLGKLRVTGAGDDITANTRRVTVEQSLDLSPNIADNTPPAAPRGVLSR